MSFDPDSAHVARLHPSRNCELRRKGRRADMLIVHYTGLPTVERAIDVLSREDCRVSCHYVVDVDGTVIQMVPEALRAWHAGVSHWAGETDINSCSIGIEIQHPGHDHGYPEFGAAQMSAVAKLCLDVMARNAIVPERFLAHSDVAPFRKIDPGEKFPWAGFARLGIGRWVSPEPAREIDPGYGPGSGGPLVGEAQRLLARIGYGVAATGEMDAATVLVVKAFQRHYRPERVDGRLDRSTLDAIGRLAGGATAQIAAA